MPTTCFRPWQVRFSKRYERCSTGQLAPTDSAEPRIDGFAKEETSFQLGGASDLDSNAGQNARLLPDRVFQDWLRHLDNAVANCVQHQLAQTMETEFAHDVAAVSFRRLHAEIEHHRDFFGALSFRQELYDFPLAPCQPR